jgi:predicted ATPase/DNA-binding XRE family transcriptional regulator
MAFGALLRRYRRQAGLSQEELAAKAYVSARTISDLERGANARPRVHTAVALADGLGLDDEARIAFERHARPDDDASERTADAAPPTPGSARAPLTVDSFVDDDSNLDNLLRLVREGNSRLITLTGPGGVGKTRLALEMAQRLDAPVAFVALASLTEPGLLPATLVAALGADHGPSRTHLESLVEHIAATRLVLVLDNMEQLVAAAAEVAWLIRSCRRLTVVATSRVPLRVTGEVRFPVRGLATAGPAGGGPAVQLFVDRAAAIGADTIGETDRAAIAELCARLDGLPLAIELAAARSAIVPPSELLRHLDQVLDLLSGGRTDASSQHRGMRATLEWSAQLLTPAAGDAFASLGVFATSASVDAAMSVWGLAPSATPAFYDLVEALSDAHMITVERVPSGIGGPVRIAMAEPTRQFALELLTESGGAQLANERLVEWALALAERAEPAIIGADQLAWLTLLDVELPNLRQAGRYLEGVGTPEATETTLRIASALQRYWDIRTRWREGLAWLAAGLSQPGGSDAVRGKAHKALGVMHRCLGDLDHAEAEMRQAVALHRAAGDQYGAASCLNNLGVAALDRALYDDAIELLSQAMDAFEDQDERPLPGLVLNNLGVAILQTGQRRIALRLLRRARRLLADHGNVSVLGRVDTNIATVVGAAGYPRLAIELHRRAIRDWLTFDDEDALVWALEAMAASLTASGDAETAARMLGFVAAHRQRLGALPVPFFQALTAARRAAVEAELGPDRAAALWHEGSELSPAAVKSWFSTRCG